MPVMRVSSIFDDDVCMRLEEADELLGRRDRLASQDAALGLVDDAFYEGKKVRKRGDQAQGPASRELLQRSAARTVVCVILSRSL